MSFPSFLEAIIERLADDQLIEIVDYNDTLCHEDFENEMLSRVMGELDRRGRIIRYPNAARPDLAGFEVKR